MVIGRVRGTVVSTEKSPKLSGLKLFVVIPIDLDSFEEKGMPMVCIDTVGAGEGEVVMCVAGSSARQTERTKDMPCDNGIVAIIDHIDLRGKRIYEKFPKEV